MQSLVSLDLSGNPLSSTPLLSLLGSQESNAELRDFVEDILQLEESEQAQAEIFLASCLEDLQARYTQRLTDPAMAPAPAEATAN